MGSDTCLQRSPGSIHSPHQSKNTPGSPEITGKSRNKYNKEILSLKQVTSPLIMITVQTRSFIYLFFAVFSEMFLA